MGSAWFWPQFRSDSQTLKSGTLTYSKNGMIFVAPVTAATAPSPKASIEK